MIMYLIYVCRNKKYKKNMIFMNAFVIMFMNNIYICNVSILIHIVQCNYV